MAKEKPPSTTLSKDERKALRRAEKEQKEKKTTTATTKTKRSDSDGVHKSKDGKKEKKKKKERAALKEKVANAVERGEVLVAVENGDGNRQMEVEVKSDVEGEDGEKKEKKNVSAASRPVGALVPFANPLADEKVAKKVFRGVKRGVFQIFRYCLWKKKKDHSHL